MEFVGFDFVRHKAKSRAVWVLRRKLRAASMLLPARIHFVPEGDLQRGFTGRAGVKGSPVAVECRLSTSLIISDR